MAGIAPRTLNPPQSYDHPFMRAAGESDRDTAERVVRLLRLPLATPVHSFNIGHDHEGRLVLDFYHANGRHKVTVLPERLHIEESRAGIGKYLSTLHVTTAAFRSGDSRMQVWSWFNELAMWTLVVMLATGAWLLIARRRRAGALRRTHWIAGLIALPLLAFFAASAVQMAHRTWWTANALWKSLAAMHRARGVAPPLATVLLLVLIATGVCLWYRGRDRRAGAVLLTASAVISGGLIVWMRGG